MMRIRTRQVVTLGVALTLFLVPSPSRGGLGRGEKAAHTSAAGNPLCRIHNYLPNNSANVGSGTLIDVTDGGERGLILTCAHLFTEGTGRVVVQFPSGQTHGALVIGLDQDADLAALEIAKPNAQPATVDSLLTSLQRMLDWCDGKLAEYQPYEVRSRGET